MILLLFFILVYVAIIILLGHTIYMEIFMINKRYATSFEGLRFSYCKLVLGTSSAVGDDVEIKYFVSIHRTLMDRIRGKQRLKAYIVTIDDKESTDMMMSYGDVIMSNREYFRYKLKGMIETTDFNVAEKLKNELGITLELPR